MNITRKTAELAKEKGFNVPCNHYVYTPKDLESLNKNQHDTGDVFGPDHVFSQQNKFLKGRLTDRNKYHTTISIPTQAVLQRWLREVHSIETIAFRNAAGYSIAYEKATLFKIGRASLYTIYESYEIALEISLQEGLKLID